MGGLAEVSASHIQRINDEAESRHHASVAAGQAANAADSFARVGDDGKGEDTPWYKRRNWIICMAVSACCCLLPIVLIASSATTLEGAQLVCETGDLTQDECSSMGCCEWTGGACWSAVGQSECDTGVDDYYSQYMILQENQIHW